MHRLHLLRHAKSSWADGGLEDRDRPLNDRGRRACELLAAHLASAGIAPDLVLASPARRVAETIDGIRRALPADVPIRVDERLYTAAADDLLAVLAGVSPTTREVLLVSHNPAIEDLALGLVDDHADAAALRMGEKYPTGALASYEVIADWDALDRGGTRLTSFVRPRDLIPPQDQSASTDRSPSPTPAPTAREADV